VSTATLCECGCGESLEGRRSDARFYSDVCRFRAWQGVRPRRVVAKRAVTIEFPSGMKARQCRCDRPITYWEEDFTLWCFKCGSERAEV